MAAKLFLGGIAPTTQKEDVEAHFSTYGTVIDSVVMYKDGRHRGFGFVTFAEEEAMHAVLAEPQVIHDRTIDVKQAVPSTEAPPPRNGGFPGTIRLNQIWGSGGAVVGPGGGCYRGYGGGGGAIGAVRGGGGGGGYPRPSARPALPAHHGGGGGGGGHKGATDKVFIGGLAPTTTDEMLSNHFGQYGSLVDVVVMKDKITQKSRGFGFVRYDSTEPVEQVMADYQTHEIDGKWIEVKRAVPQDQMAPFSLPARGPAFGGKGAFGGGGYGPPTWGPPPGAYGCGGYRAAASHYGGFGGAYTGGGMGKGAFRPRPY